MGKRPRRACTEKDNKSADESSIDGINMLPDELLSFLTLKEATATSILSRRWRYLWTFIPILDFDGNESLLKLESTPIGKNVLLRKERTKYVRWVNRVLALHKNSSIEEFRVFFNLRDTQKKPIEKWLRYALARKVQRLELNLTTLGSPMFSRSVDEHYTFPYELLHTDKHNVSNCSQPISWNMKQSNLIDFKYLKSITMNHVNVNDEALEFFLCNCPLLEHLSVSESRVLSTLKITGLSYSLKRLEISSCNMLKSVEIRDANLVHLKYEGSRIDFLLENVPLLVDMFIGEPVTNHMEDVVLMLSSYLPQFEILTIHKSGFFWQETEMFYSAVKMSNLKQLVVKCFASNDHSYLPLTNLIRASPSLQKFVLEAPWLFPVIIEKKVKRGKKVKKVARDPYIHLKEVEFLGYLVQTSDLELVEHFLENAVALEKILLIHAIFISVRKRKIRPLRWKWMRRLVLNSNLRRR